MGLDRKVVAFNAVGQVPGDTLADLICELFHPLPRDEKGSAYNQHNRGAKEQLALGGERDFHLPEAFEHAQAIVWCKLVLWNCLEVWYDISSDWTKWPCWATKLVQ